MKTLAGATRSCHSNQKLGNGVRSGQASSSTHESRGNRRTITVTNRRHSGTNVRLDDRSSVDIEVSTDNEVSRITGEHIVEQLFA